MACELDDDEVMRLLEEINSDDSEIEDNIIEDFEEEDSDADSEYYPPAIQDEDIIENIMNIQNEELPISSRICFENDNVVGKNGFKWQSKCNLIPSTSKITSKNIVHILSGPLGNALFSNEPVEYRSTMSLAMFNFIINCLRFDLKNTRDERKTITKFAPISETWEILMKNCQKWYKPGLYLTIDEQLVGFRGCCPFKIYIPSKPNKYGIKIIMMCDNSTNYMISAILYCGKGTVPSSIPAAHKKKSHTDKSGDRGGQ
ncbi:piggyBac transposable element-derived protein 4-like, partial [Aphis craccivora]